MASFLHIGPAMSKKKKRQHADKEAEKVSLLDEHHTVNPKTDGPLSLSIKRHIKKKQKHHEAKFQDSDMDVQIEHNISEPENHQIRSEQKSVKNKVPCKTLERLEEDCVCVKVIKKSVREREDKEWEGNIDDAANENDLLGVSDECPFRIKKHKKSKRKTYSSKMEDNSANTSDIDIQTEHNILEPENHHIRSEQKSVKNKVPCSAIERLDEDSLRVKVMKKSIREREDNEWEGNIEDSANENGLHRVGDECPFCVKKHKKSKRKTYSSEMEDTSANTSEDCFDKILKLASNTKKRHKKSKNKTGTVGGVPCVSEAGEVDILDSKNLEILVEKKKDAENECHPEKKRKMKKQAREEHASPKHKPTAPVVSDCEMHRDQGYLGQTEYSTEPADQEKFLKTKHAHKSSKHQIKNSETVEVPISTPTKVCIVEPETLSGDMSDEQSFAQVKHVSAHKGKKRKKPMAKRAVSAADERSDETESMGDASYGTVEEWVLADEPSNETTLNLLEEFIPNIRTKNQYTIRDLLKYDLQRFLTFKEQGIPIRYGRFSAEENEQLEQNMKAYLELTGIDSADKVLHPFRYPEETKAIQEAKSQHLLLHYIAVGIARPCRLIKGRAQKMFDPFNYKGRYSTEEINELRRHQATCGNDWSQISNRMARSNHSVALKFSQLRNPINNKGNWSKAEMKRLVQAVQHYLQRSHSHNELENMAARMAQSSTDEVMSLMRDRLYKGISWVEVEAKVGTRNWMQCKLKWSGYLTKKMNRGAKVYSGQNALRAKIRLIQRLYESRVEDSSELDWEDLAECIGNFPPAYVQNKFYRLKSQYVPTWHTKTFTEIVDHLHDKILPEFESKLKEKETDEETPLEQLQKVYQFADIFQDSDFDDSDPEDQ